MDTNLIPRLADAMQRMEGYKPGTRAWRNNNPGNIWDGLTSGKVRRIWPNLPIDDKGFIIYPSPQAGRAALENDLRIKVSRGMTLEALISMFAPPHENNTAAYIRNVSTWSGIPTGVVLSSWGGEAAAPVIVARDDFPVGLAPDGSGPGSDVVEAFLDSFQSGDTENAALLIAAGLALAAAAVLA